VNPSLTLFCTQLTGITQDMVSSEADFPAVFADFVQWMAADGPGCLLTCGNWDLGVMLPSQLTLCGLVAPELACGNVSLGHWINVKKSYHESVGSFPRGMTHMLRGIT